MPNELSHRCWIVGYFTSWVLAGSGTLGLAAAIVASCLGPRIIDDGAAWFGIPAGALLGWWAARSTRRRRGVHRVLLGGGLLITVAAAAGAAAMFAASSSQQGKGLFSGLGEAIAGFACLAVAVLGTTFGAAGATGWLATRTAPEA